MDALSIGSDHHGQILTVNFLSSVAANTAKTVVSKRISRPFKLLLIRPHFILNTNRKVRLYFFVSPDDSSPSSLPLTGSNLIAEASQTNYIVGDDEYKMLWQNWDSQSGGHYLKVFANNTDTFEHAIDVQMFIELLQTKE